MSTEEVNSGRIVQDVAGHAYWDTLWQECEAPVLLWPVDSSHFRFSPERRLFWLMCDHFQRHLIETSGKRLLEVGCARSDVLPLFYLKAGFNIWGMDYSEKGCGQAREVLQREAVPGTVILGDVFDPPQDLLESFDAIVSFGLVEHFSDTAAIVSAMARLLRPGGVMFTHIPNMNGLTGLAQQWFDHRTYDVHVPVDVDQLRAAHAAAGLEVLDCSYFMSINLGVVNIDSLVKSTIEWKLKRFLLTWLTRVSKLVWLFEQHWRELPALRWSSPYINCVAAKPVHASASIRLGMK